MRVSAETHGDERLVLLAAALDGRVGLTFEEMSSRGLLGDPAGSEKTLRRALERACRQFDEMGIKVVDEELGGERRYRIEGRLTYAQGAQVTLDPQDAPDLLAAVTAYLQGARRPYEADVRRARDKLASAMGMVAASPVVEPVRADVPRDEQTYHTLRRCQEERTPCAFSYQDAYGSAGTHVLHVYEFFDRRGKTYVVGYDESHAQDGPERVFRLDRIVPGSAAALPRTYTVPETFDVADYMRLPFEYGEQVLFHARFACADEARPAAQALVGERGVWTRGADKDWIWSIEVCDLNGCAMWAAAAACDGLLVREPAELVEAVRAGLQRTVSAHA